jgi:addiction module HigA family antidote
MSALADALHPATRIKAEVIPPGMSVTKAAQLMGVGRPALSNLLNGKAALSPEMAARLEKAFKYPLKNLMAMQASYDAAQARKKDAPADTKAYVPPFLAIKANDIEGWVSHTGVYNSRGVQVRGEGGDQERELAEKYRKWGQALQVSHPFVAAKLLMGLAQTYDHEASREDTEAGIRRRLR